MIDRDLAGKVPIRLPTDLVLSRNGAAVAVAVAVTTGADVIRIISVLRKSLAERQGGARHSPSPIEFARACVRFLVRAKRPAGHAGAQGRAAAHPRAAAGVGQGARRLVIDDTRIGCPLKLESNPMSMLPMHVPSCPDLHTTLTLWDVPSGAPIHEIAHDTVPSKPATTAAQIASAMAMKAMLAAQAPRPAVLALADGDTAIRTSVDFALRPSENKAELRITSDRIALDQDDRLTRLACARLPSDMREPGQATWTRWLPGEPQRAICGARGPAAPAIDGRNEKRPPTPRRVASRRRPVGTSRIRMLRSAPKRTREGGGRRNVASGLQPAAPAGYAAETGLPC